MKLKSDRTYAKAGIFLILISLFGLTLGIFAIYKGINPKVISNTDVISVNGTYDHYKFNTVSKSPSHGILYLENSKHFDVSTIYSRKFNWKEFEQDVHKGDTLYLKDFKNDVNASYPYVLEISTKNKTYLSFDDVKKCYLSNDNFGGFICLASIILFVTGIYFLL